MGRYGKTNKASLVVMFSILALLFLYLANVLPVLRITFCFISSIFIYGIMMERMPVAALVSFFVIAFIGFVIVPDKSGMLPYLFFFGHYGFFKYFLDGTGGGAAVAGKLVYFNIGIALIYFFGGGFLLAQLPWELPIWLTIALAEVIFLVYDWLFTKISLWYYGSVRNRLINNTWG